MGWSIRQLGYGYNITASPVDAWATIILMDVWHWTPLIALLCYSGLRSIPDAYYQAARIDRASKWAVFRYIQLPKLTNVLVIGVLLRFMHSFMIYAEPFVLTGRPRQLHDFPQPVADDHGHRSAGLGALSGVLADLFPDHPAGHLGVLHRDHEHAERRQQGGMT